MEDLFGPLSSDSEVHSWVLKISKSVYRTIQKRNLEWSTGVKLEYEIKEIKMLENCDPVLIREFTYHPLSAHVAWPGNTVFIQWIMDNAEQYFPPKTRIFEIGAATGVLSIFLKKNLKDIDIVTSDYADPQIGENLAENWKLNKLEPCPHIPHTWGDPFPWANDEQSFDVIIGNDILIYVNQYADLVKTLSTVMRRNPKCVCFISWGRRIRKEHENKFFTLAHESGIDSQHLKKKVHKLTLRNTSEKQP